MTTKSKEVIPLCCHMYISLERARRHYAAMLLYRKFDDVGARHAVPLHRWTSRAAATKSSHLGELQLYWGEFAAAWQNQRTPILCQPEPAPL